MLRPIPKPHRDLIDLYLAHLRMLRRSHKTIKGYGYALTRAHEELPVGLATAVEPELTGWITNPRWSAATQALYTTAMRQFFGWCVARQHLTRDPSTVLQRPKLPRRVPRPATPHQVATILAMAREPVRLWSLIASHCGARAIEVSRLDRDHVTESVIRLWGKGDAERIVPTHPAIWAAVRGLPSGPIPGVDPDDPDRVSIRAHHEYHRIGVATSIHRLRVYFATEARRGGADPRTVQVLLGHASLATTQVYLGVDPEELRSAVAGLPVLSAVGGDVPRSSPAGAVRQA